MPQLCAMSVAFDAHGEIVPKRGITKNSSVAPLAAWPCAGSPYVSMASRRLVSSADSGVLESMKWTKRAWTAATCGAAD